MVVHDRSTVAADDISKLPVSCNKDCGGGCPLLAHVEEGRLIKITNNPRGTRYMTGCIRGFQMPREVYAKGRLRRPLWRTGPKGSGQFDEIPWEEALDRIAEQLVEIRDRHGPEAILSLGGSGSCRGALHNTSRLKARFLSLFGGCTSTYSSYSSAATSFVTPFVYGTSQVGLDPQTLLHSSLILLWGANISDLRFGCDLEGCLLEAKRRGTPIWVVDPRRTRTVKRLASEWLPVWPGTDTALMMGVLYVLLQEDLVEQDFVRRYSHGFDRLTAHVLGQGEDGVAKTPAWAEEICGTPREQIIELARQYGRAKPAALIPGLSIQRTIGGEEAARMAMALQVATGNVGVRGGSSGGHVWGRLPRPRCGSISAPPSPASAAVPVYRWPDAVLGGREAGYPSDIRAIYNVGGNYVCQGSDVGKNIQAFRAVDFAVCHDLFLTPTARYCDIVLPATSFLERDDIVFPAGNYVLFSTKVADPPGEARHDYDIFCGLADRLGFAQAFSENRSAEAWLRHFVAQSEIPDYDTFRQAGIYMGADQERVGLADFVADPEAHPLDTPSGRIEVASERYAARTGFPAIPIPRPLPSEEGFPLRLITPHPRHRTHSQRHTMSPARRARGQALWIHPQDAGARDIQDGDTVEVQSAHGRLQVKARVTEEIMPGVVSLLEGVWPKFDTNGIEINGSPNVLTSTDPTQPSQGARTHSTWVDVTAL